MLPDVDVTLILPFDVFLTTNILPAPEIDALGKVIVIPED
jgi:hypothetical protein